MPRPARDSPASVHERQQQQRQTQDSEQQPTPRRRPLGFSLPSARPLAASTGSSLKSRQLTQLLSLRLSYARFKVDKGWSASNLDEVEMLSSTNSKRPLPPRPTTTTNAAASAPGRPATVPLAPLESPLPAVVVNANGSSSTLAMNKHQQGDALQRPHSTATFGHSASSSRSSFSAASSSDPSAFAPLSSTSTSSSASAAAHSLSSSVHSAGPLYSSYASSTGSGVPPSPYPQAAFQYLDPPPSDPEQMQRRLSISSAAPRPIFHQQAGLIPSAPPMVNSFSEPGYPPPMNPSSIGASSTRGLPQWRPPPPQQQDPWSVAANTATDRYNWSQQRQLAPVAEYTAYQPPPPFGAAASFNQSSGSNTMMAPPPPPVSTPFAVQRPASGPSVQASPASASSSTPFVTSSGSALEPGPFTTVPLQYQHPHHSHPHSVPPTPQLHQPHETYLSMGAGVAPGQPTGGRNTPTSVPASSTSGTPAFDLTATDPTVWQYTNNAPSEGSPGVSLLPSADIR